MIKLGQMVLKGVNWLHNDKNRSNGLERSQLVLKGVNWVQITLENQVSWVHNTNISSNGLERSHLGTQ